MLERALCIVLLALLPLALAQFPISEIWLWRFCGALAFVLMPTLNWTLIHRLRQLPNYAPGRSYFLSSQINLAFELGVLAAGFFGLVPLAAAYGLALLLELVTVGGMFLRVIASITLSARTSA
ncbi:MAG: hypothetical protein QNK05_14760 [Myxococcota bacterium]|nr:hypothetical protein [Myxococcota bacterium]